jgi:MFS family permease
MGCSPSRCRTTPGVSTIRPKLFFGWYIVGAAFASLFIQASTGGFVFSIFLSAMTEDLGWPRSTMVFASSVAFITAAFAGPWLGRIVDRRGPRLVMVLSVLGMAAALGGASLVQAPWQFFLCIGLLSGVSRSALQSVLPGSMIANWFLRRRSTAYGIAAMGPPVGNFLLPPIITALVAAGGWRNGWIGMGVIPLVIGLVPALFIARRIEGTGWQPDGDTVPAAAGVSVRPSAAAGAVAEDWTISEATHSRSFWMVATGMALVLLAPNTSIVFLFSYFSSMGMETHTAALAISMVSGLQMVSRLVFWGPVIGKIGSVQRVLVLWGGMLLTSTITFGVAQGEFWAFVAGAVLGVAIGGNLVLHLQIWPEYFGRKAVGAITGTAQMVQGVSQAVIPLGLASLLDLTGSYSVMYLTLSAFVFAGLVLLVKVGRPRRPGVTVPAH